MTEKVRVITPESGLSLGDLDVNPGDWAGFGNMQIPSFMIAKVGGGGLRRVNPNRQGFIGELSLHQFINDEGRTFIFDPTAFFYLRTPNSGGSGKREPNMGRGSSVFDMPYTVEYAYSGKRQILRALRERDDIGFDLYADLLGSRWRKDWLEKLGKAAREQEWR